MKNWYPETLNVGNQGTPRICEFLKTVYQPDHCFHYAELGIYQVGTPKNICAAFPNAVLHLFDYQSVVDNAKKTLNIYSNEIFYYGNTTKYFDSYNWALNKLINSQNGMPLFDYCFLDGAHTFAIDALSFFLCDRLLKIGGYIDFDDYNWRLRGSSLDPAKTPITADQYTEEQIDAYQVRLIVDNLVRRDTRYEEVIENKLFKKISE